MKVGRIEERRERRNPVRALAGELFETGVGLAMSHDESKGTKLILGNSATTRIVPCLHLGQREKSSPVSSRSRSSSDFGSDAGG